MMWRIYSNLVILQVIKISQITHFIIFYFSDNTISLVFCVIETLKTGKTQLCIWVFQNLVFSTLYPQNIIQTIILSFSHLNALH